MSTEVLLALGIALLSLALGLSAQNWRQAVLRAAGWSIIIKLIAGLVEIAPIAPDEWLFSAGWFARLAGMGVGYALLGLLGLTCRRATSWVERRVWPNIMAALKPTITTASDIDFPGGPTGQWRAPSDATSLIGKRLGWQAWSGIGIGLSALIALWAFTPGGRDRWVKQDGAIACQGATEIEDIQSTQSASSRRLTIEDLVVEKKCVPLFADDRVRIGEIGEDGNKVRVVLGTSGRSMWMQLADLKPNSPTLLTMPWLWKEEPPTAPGLNEKAQNPFDEFDKPSAEDEGQRRAADTPAE